MDEKQNVKYYEFKDELADLPDIPQNDPRYSDPHFFELTIANKSGEPIKYKTSYQGIRSGIPLAFGGYLIEAVMETLEGKRVSSVRYPPRPDIPVSDPPSESQIAIRIRLLVKVMDRGRVQLKIDMSEDDKVGKPEIRFTRDNMSITPEPFGDYTYLESEVPPGSHTWQATAIDGAGREYKSNQATAEVSPKAHIYQLAITP